jgi:hypothetical protein
MTQDVVTPLEIGMFFPGLAYEPPDISQNLHGVLMGHGARVGKRFFAPEVSHTTISRLRAG